MRNKLTKIALTASVLFALAFIISCAELNEALNEDDNSSSSGKRVSSSSKKNGSSSSAKNNNSSNGFNGNSQIYNYECGYYGDDDEDWTCKVVAYTGDGFLYDWILKKSVGTVTKGKVDMKLPSTIPAENYEELNYYYFGDESEYDIDEYCEEYTKDVGKYEIRTDLRESNDGEGWIGDLRIQDDNSYDRIAYWYFSKDGKIKCDFYNVSYDLTFKKGWNQIYQKMTIRENDDDDYPLYVDKWSTKDILTKEVKWFYSQDSGD